MNTENAIKLFKENPAELIKEANNVCRKYYSNKVYIRGLFEFSNYCVKNCSYCGIRTGNKKIKRYRMEEEEIYKIVKKGYDRGLRTFVLQSGEDLYFTTDKMCKIVENIKKITNYDCAITLSCGMKTYKDYKALVNSGADRYLMRFETSDAKLYKKFKSGETLEERIEAIYNIKDAGMETGSGFMVGLPGENEETIINNVLLCKKLDLDMAGIGPFIPHPDTPLKNSKQEPIEKTVNATALLRLMIPKANLPATTAAGTLDPFGREKMLEAGANVLMPNITPPKFKQYYLLYPNKICIDESGFECIGCLSARVKTINKEISLERGNSVNFKKHKAEAKNE